MNDIKTGFRPFGIRDKLGYLFGDFGNDFTFLLSSSFLLKFYTDVMGVSAGICGTIMMISRFIDAFTDVFMGRLCDRSRVTAVGKFKPWILRMAAPVAISSFLIYQSAFRNYALWFKILWLFVTYVLWGSFFYTSINIPYGSMSSTISPHPDDRQSLSTYRTMGSTFAGAIVGILVPIFAYTVVDNTTVLDGKRFTVIAGIFSILAIISYILCYFLTTERVRPKSHAVTKTSIGNLLHGAIRNRALTSIILASVLMLLSQLTMQSMANYIYPNYYNNADAQSVSTLTMLLGMLIAATFAKRLAKAVGKAEISSYASLLAAGVSLLLFFIRPKSVWTYILLTSVGWVGLGVFAVVSWALITDVIDYSEIKNGVREDGSIYALYSFSRKLGQAASAGLTGLLLELIGYSQQSAFSEPVLRGIFNISTLVPAIGFSLLALILKFLYPLHKKEVEKNVNILLQKHKS
jgi:GPH family glycoside/pentoside/hexuronide:cation symporter